MDRPVLDRDVVAVRDRVRSLAPQHWIPDPHLAMVSVLAHGTYHTSLLVRTREARVVARLCRDSQWGLSPTEQLEREFTVLGALEPSRVAPMPLMLIADAEREFLLESFVGGRAFDYTRDMGPLAHAIARVHACSPLRASFALPDTSPTDFLLNDGRQWADRARRTPRLSGVIEMLDEAEQRLRTLGTSTSSDHVLLHTDLIHTNIRRTDSGCVLLDWEGARAGPRAWDLAYLLSPVTLMWSDQTSALVGAGRKAFMSAYAAAAGLNADDVEVEVDALSPFVIFRALAWCTGFSATAVITAPRVLERLDQICTPAFVRDHLLTGLG